MGYVFDFRDAEAYEKWAENERHTSVIRLQTGLMLDMLRPARGESVLDIGCGTGLIMRVLIDKGLRVTGIDPSPYMLDVAKKHLGRRACLHRGVAEDLPFDDNAFNHAVLFTTLEFVNDPLQALEEACRVAKDRLFVGVLNRYALISLQRRLKGIFTDTIYNRARFFSVWELTAMLRGLLGNVPIEWKSVCHLPLSAGRLAQILDASELARRTPFGAFVGVSAQLVPRFRTRPLELKYAPPKRGEAVAGSLPAGTLNANNNAKHMRCHRGSPSL
ncbi:MAG: class I SAM-dependent methyltransferase [Thermodesulfobacteriota bacterium]|nr:class I SAM-dependent methyltransferase [Thermodesulfobacteriota bacterium]